MTVFKGNPLDARKAFKRQKNKEDAEFESKAPDEYDMECENDPPRILPFDDSVSKALLNFIKNRFKKNGAKLIEWMKKNEGRKCVQSTIRVLGMAIECEDECSLVILEEQIKTCKEAMIRD